MIKLVCKFGIGFLCLLSSCVSVLEEDITRETIRPLYPQVNGIHLGNTVKFSWEKNKKVEKYQVQVFGQHSILLDTIVSNNYINYNLDEAHYTWRVRGVNFAYETSYSDLLNFSIQNSDNLSNQTVVLTSPSDLLYTNNSNITLRWKELPNTLTYTLLIEKMNQSGTTTIYENNALQGSKDTPSSNLFLENAKYTWKITAQNNTSTSIVAGRSFYIDKLVPNTPLLKLPSEASSFKVNEMITLEWDVNDNVTAFDSPIFGVLEIATNTNFSNVLFTFSNLETNKKLITFNQKGVYYWRIKTIDSAGNVSGYSTYRSLVISE